MKVLLLTPPHTASETHATSMAGTVAGVQPPTGLLYLAAALRVAGHEVRFIDGGREPPARLLRAAQDFAPTLVGIGGVVHLWPRMRDLAVDVKRVAPACFVVVGGAGPNVLRENCLADNTAVDGLVIGEGETTICRLADADNPAEVGALPGYLSRRQWLQGERVVEPSTPVDLDTLPYPAYDLIDLGDYRPSIGSYRRLPAVPVFTSRGCPYHCAFCSKILGAAVRFRRPADCVAEIETYVRRLGAREIILNDENFTLRPDRVREFCETMLDRQVRVLWSAAGRVDSACLDPVILRDMKRAGCWFVQFGVESGVQKNLDFLDKGTTLDQARRAVRLVREAGMSAMTFFVLGIPGETEQEARQTIRFARELNAHDAQFFPLTPFPGTVLSATAPRYGQVDDDLAKYNMHAIVFVPNTMTRETLEALLRQAYLQFCLRPGFIWLRLRRLRYLEDVRIIWRGLRFIGALVREEIRQSRRRSRVVP